MCTNGLKFGRNCQNASHVPITREIRELFLNEHNAKRSLVAKGRFFWNSAATRMATVVWDDELEMLALANVLQCQMDHDQCRKTKRFPFAGQNLYKLWTSDKDAINDDYIMRGVKTSMDIWFQEYKLVKNISWIQAFGSNSAPWWEIGHFTQMIWGDSAAIGCAIAQNQADVYIACNYAKTNMMGSSVYENGTMGSKCQMGMNREYPGLCNVNEFIKVLSISEAPPVTKWIHNGKTIDESTSKKSTINVTNESIQKAKHNQNSSRSNKNVNILAHIIILALNTVIAKILIA
ncbi:scoloptoxin SSD552-like [Sitodiplosis mosellana]|uniref:scoloptoxin SSD552-like n=1 Tax=Sitodiplosis mosellana TaxID=263140 RepID=UPI002443DC44|nr:scoloptoxin SSD552-like [Sitodiplosis mosellana]